MDVLQLPITKVARKPSASDLLRLLFLLLRLLRPAAVMALLRAAPPTRRAPKASIMKNWPSIQIPHLSKRGGRLTAIFAQGFVTHPSPVATMCNNDGAKMAVTRPPSTCSGGSAGRSERCPGRGPRTRLRLRRANSPSSERRQCHRGRTSLTIGDLSLEAVSCDYCVYCYLQAS